MVTINKTPSLQHTVALMSGTVEETLLNLKNLEDSQIKISLASGRRLFKPLMEGIGIDWALAQCALEKDYNIGPNQDLVAAFAPYAAGKSVSWFREFPKLYFPIGSGISVPINPAGYWNDSGLLRVMWVQSWKGRTLNPLQKAIFNSVLQKTVFVGDFKSAALEWVDLREKFPRRGREVEVLDGNKLGLVSDGDLETYFGIFLKALEEFAPYRAEKRAERKAKQKEKADKGTPLLDYSPDL